MPTPEDRAGHSPEAGGFRDHLSRTARVNFYLRVLFSLLTLVYAGLGPGLLLRFPSSGVAYPIEPLAQFYAFRPVIYALLFIALVCVLAALCHRAAVLFEAEFAADARMAGSTDERVRYLQLLRPSPTPFVLSGNVPVDLTIFVAGLLAYSFWVVVLAETTPSGLSGHQSAGIVVGSYGLFAALIVTGLVWFNTARRFRRLTAARSDQDKPPVT